MVRHRIYFADRVQWFLLMVWMWGIREWIPLVCYIAYKSQPLNNSTIHLWGPIRLNEHCIINHLALQGGATNSVSNAS